MQTPHLVLKSLLSLGLGYMRWTQLTPMVLLWGFGLIMLLLLTFVNFQEQAISVLEFILQWLIGLPWVGEHIQSLLSGEDVETYIKAHDLESLVFSSWAILSLVFMLASMVLSFFLGPFRPWPLRRKLQIAACATVLLLIGMAANYFAAPHNFNGAASAWMLNFSLISLLVFGVSAYCLSISHFLGYLNDALLAGEPDASNEARSIR